MQERITLVQQLTLCRLIFWCYRVANNFKTSGAMWAPNFSRFTSPHWYFGAHIFNEMLKAVIKKTPNILHGTPWINFHIMFMRTTLYDLIWSNDQSDTKNVLLVANTENRIEIVNIWVKT